MTSTTQILIVGDDDDVRLVLERELVPADALPLHGQLERGSRLYPGGVDLLHSQSKTRNSGSGETFDSNFQKMFFF